MKLSWKSLVTLRYLQGKGPGKSGSLKRIRGAITGIALSLIPLVLVYQVADGMIEGITARYLETGSFHLQAHLPDVFDQPDGSPDDNYLSVVRDLRKVKDVVFAGEEIQGMVLASSGSASLGLSVRAVDPALADDPGFRTYLKVLDGTLDLSSDRSVILGQEAARLLGVKAGDSLRFLSARTDGSAFIPKVTRLTVAGVVSSGYQSLDRIWCFMNLERGRKILPPETITRVVSIKVAHPYDLPNPLFEAPQESRSKLMSDIRKVLGTAWTTSTWYELNKAQYLSFVTTRNLLLFIMFLIVLIASVNVSSSMIMLVMEKQHEIAILKSMGASPSSITGIFMTAGVVSGGLGGIVGLSIGAALSLVVNEIIHGLELGWNALSMVLQFIADPEARYQELQIFNPAYYLERIPIQIKPEVLLLILGLTLVLSLAASWFPARRAARLRPLEIMRKV